MQRLFTQKHQIIRLIASVGLGLGLAWPGAASLESGMQAYETGDAVAAAVLLKPQAEQGVSEAQLALGYLYYVGRGVQQNHALAARWFNAAAAQGEAAAMYNLAWLYETGEGVQPNAAKRANWLTKSAQAGYPLAQYELAQMLALSTRAADQQAAKSWRQKAAAAGLGLAAAENRAAVLPLPTALPAAAAVPAEAAVPAPKPTAAPSQQPITPPVVTTKARPEPPPVVAEVETQAISRSVPVGKPLPPLAETPTTTVVKSAPATETKSLPKPSPAILSSTPNGVAPDGARGEINVSIANMRAAPSSQAATKSRLVRGVEIVIHETFAGWTRVTVVSQPQLNGWVNSSVYRPIQ
jgi:hypothetical protein